MSFPQRKHSFSKFINNLSSFIDEPTRIYFNTSGNNGAYNPATLVKNYTVHTQGIGIRRILDHEDNYKVVYPYIYGTSARRWGISYYDNSSDSFLPHNPTGHWGTDTDYIVDDACLYDRNEEKEYIYKVGTNDGTYYWDPDDPTNISDYIKAGHGSSYLSRRRCLSVFDGYLWIGGRHVSGTDHAGIVRSTTGDDNDFTEYWKYNDYVPSSDPKYNNQAVWSINKLDEHIFWGTTLGQLWGDINGGTSCLFDFRPGDTTTNRIRSTIKYRSHYVTSSHYEIAISTDGINWAQQPIPTDCYAIWRIYEINDVIFLLGKNTSNYPAIWTTTNYIDWYNFYVTTTQPGYYFYDILFDGTYFWCCDETSVKVLNSTKM